MLKGYRLTNNEFNVIASNFYPAKNGKYRKIMEHPDVAEFDFTTTSPAYEADGKWAKVKCFASWMQKGKRRSIGFSDPAKGQEDTLIFRIRVNANMGEDAVIGKALSKLFGRVLSRIEGKIIAESTDLEYEIPGDAINVTPQGARTLTPEGKAGPDPYVVKDPEPSGTPPPPPPQEWKCPTCGLACVSERGLKKHMTQTHPPKPETVELPTGPATPPTDRVIDLSNPPPDEPPHPADGPGPVVEKETDGGKDFFEEAKNYEEALSKSGEWAKLMTAFAVKQPGEIKPNRRAYFIDQCEKRLNKLIGG